MAKNLIKLRIRHEKSISETLWAKPLKKENTTSLQNISFNGEYSLRDVVEYDHEGNVVNHPLL